MLGIVISLGVVACLLIGAFAEHMGEQRGKRETESKMQTLLSQLSMLLEERKVKKALNVIDKYVLGEASIHNLIPGITQVEGILEGERD